MDAPDNVMALKHALYTLSTVWFYLFDNDKSFLYSLQLNSKGLQTFEREKMASE